MLVGVRRRRRAPSTTYRYVITYAPDAQAPATAEHADPWGRAIVYPNWTTATRDDSDARSLVTSSDFAWGAAPSLTDWHQTVLYQLHVGSFAQTAAGAADPIGDLIAQIPYLQRLGVNAVQLLPFTEFASALSLGYNSVLPFAIERDYGTPNDFKRLVAALHAAGMRVLIDVVFNHIDTDEGGRLLHHFLALLLRRVVDAGKLVRRVLLRRRRAEHAVGPAARLRAARGAALPAGQHRDVAR